LVFYPIDTRHESVKLQKQQKIPILDRIHLEEDDFKEQSFEALIEFVVEALELESHYQANRKK
jgi:hypothetical protein